MGWADYLSRTWQFNPLRCNRLKTADPRARVDAEEEHIMPKTSGRSARSISKRTDGKAWRTHSKKDWRKRSRLLMRWL